MKRKTTNLVEAENITRKIASGHYENFPVGSILIPKKSRQHFYNLYAFMRTADDFADDQGRRVEERLRLLADWRRQLEETFLGIEPRHPAFVALSHSIEEYQLSIDPFSRLLDAFTFDVHDSAKFSTEADLYWYTARSAAPVGELVLALFGYRDADRIQLSDDICTALQLINFIQDAKEDLERGRCYFPTADLPRDRPRDPASTLLTDHALLRQLVQLQLSRASGLLKKGESLPSLVTGRLRFELRAILAEAEMMIKKIERLDYDTLRGRPKLSKIEHALALARAIFLNRRT